METFKEWLKDSKEAIAKGLIVLVLSLIGGVLVALLAAEFLGLL